MTREEAIADIRDNIKPIVGGKSLDMAIKALEQEPCGDCISREAVLDLVADYDLSMGQVVKGIHALPPVTPQQKIWHWIEHIYNGIHYIECPKCSSWFLRMYLTRNSYCPNCGAKMQEVEE